jgi:hypothetical protein
LRLKSLCSRKPMLRGNCADVVWCGIAFGVRPEGRPLSGCPRRFARPRRWSPFTTRREL